MERGDVGRDDGGQRVADWRGGQHVGGQPPHEAVGVCGLFRQPGGALPEAEHVGVPVVGDHPQGGEAAQPQKGPHMGGDGQGLDLRQSRRVLLPDADDGVRACDSGPPAGGVQGQRPNLKFRVLHVAAPA